MFVMCLQMLIKVFMRSDEFNFSKVNNKKVEAFFDGYICVERSYLSCLLNEAQFLPSSGCVNTAIWMHYMDTN